MPKMRGFKAEVWTDDKFVELVPLARLLFMGMWNYSCDNGHLDDKPKQIKMRVLPTDECDPEELLQSMVDLGMVRRDADGLTVPKLRDHQRLDNRYFTWCDRCELDEIPEPARSRHPAYTTGTRREPDVNTTSARVAPSEGRKELKEGEGEGRAQPERRASQLPNDWKPSDKHATLAAELGVDVNIEAAKFRDHALANGKSFKDWEAGFRTWLRNSVRFGGVTPLPARDNGWSRRALPAPPPDIADDPARYAQWLAERQGQ